MARKVLVVDDEPSIVELVRFNLEKEGFEVAAAYDGESALEVFGCGRFDLVILDLMLPGMGGVELCQAIRRVSQVPVIMLTAKTDEFDRVLGLSIGADDYVTKPFSMRELVARVKAILRRQSMDCQARLEEQSARVFRVRDLVVDSDRFEVDVRGMRVDLTPKEFELLGFMAANAGRVLTRETLLEKVWGYDYPGNTRTVDVHIRRLRQKIESGDGPAYIHTVHGVGYKLS